MNEGWGVSVKKEGIFNWLHSVVLKTSALVNGLTMQLLSVSIVGTSAGVGTDAVLGT